MNQETRFSGHWMCAKQGKGKTHALLTMVASDLKKDCCIIVMDGKGELTAPVKSLAMGSRLVVIDPNTPFAINPLDVPKTNIRETINHLEYIFGGLLEANVTPLQKGLLRTLIRAVIIAFPNPTLQTIWRLLTAGWEPFKEYVPQLPTDLQDFFKYEWRDYDRTRGELKWRFRLLLENDLLNKMFSSPISRFHISECMDRGDVVVIDNSYAHVQEDGSTFLGRFFLGQIWAAARARFPLPQHQKKPVYVYIDECGSIIKKDPTIAHIIDMCRSQNIALILAHQRMGHIEDPNIRGAMENCAIKMVNVGMPEAKYFSELMHIPVERMNALPRGHFAMYEEGTESRIVHVEPPPIHFPYRQMSAQ